MCLPQIPLKYVSILLKYELNRFKGLQHSLPLNHNQRSSLRLQEDISTRPHFPFSTQHYHTRARSFRVLQIPCHHITINFSQPLHIPKCALDIRNYATAVLGKITNHILDQSYALRRLPGGYVTEISIITYNGFTQTLYVMIVTSKEFSVLHYQAFERLVLKSKVANLVNFFLLRRIATI